MDSSKEWAKNGKGILDIAKKDMNRAARKQHKKNKVMNNDNEVDSDRRMLQMFEQNED